MGGRGSTSSTGKGQATASALSNSFVQLTDKEASDLRDQQDSMYDATTTAGIKMYISNTNYDGQGHSLSQTLNYMLENDMDISSDSSLSYTDAVMHSAAHTFGKNIQLQRGCHDDILKQLGVNNYAKMSEAQLQNLLIGASAQFKAYVSTSYNINKNPFLSHQSGSGVAGGREVKLNINARDTTKGLFGAKKQSEVVLDKGTNFKITGVRFAKDSRGNTIYATPRGRGAMPQLEIDIETW